jgi:hypothetical protein
MKTPRTEIIFTVSGTEDQVKGLYSPGSTITLSAYPGSQFTIQRLEKVYLLDQWQVTVQDSKISPEEEKNLKEALLGRARSRSQRRPRWEKMGLKGTSSFVAFSETAETDEIDLTQELEARPNEKVLFPPTLTKDDINTVRSDLGLEDGEEDQ